MFTKTFTGPLVTADNGNALAEQLASDVAGWLQSGVDEKGFATLVVSGGSTPAPFFTALSKIEIDWAMVTVTLADERWVPPTDNKSNEKLVRETLMVNACASANFCSLFTNTPTPGEGLAACEARLRTLTLPFDVVILGMGSDGHTASLFPETPGLEAALSADNKALCQAMQPAHLEEERMTLTLKALLNSRQLVLHIVGEEKLQVFNTAIDTDSKLPIRSVADSAGDHLQIYWAA